MTPRRRIAVVAALAIASACAAVFLPGERRGVAAPPPVAAEAEGTYGLGTVEARILSRIGFDIAGTLAEVGADHGDRMARGQLLARLDAREQAARVAQAEAGVRQAQAAVLQAQARLERARAVKAQRNAVSGRRQSLVRNGTVSVEAAEDAQSNAEVAAADVAVAVSDVEAAAGGLEAARAVLALARSTLEKHSLAAPYDGIVVERSRELGTALAAGSALFVVADPASVWIQAFVDEARSGRIRVGQSASIALRSLPGVRFPGRVARIGIESDRVSEERKVFVAFDTIPADFHLGEQAEVVIDTRGAP